jgi:riboflavin kinase/FMN adenylyltransferase
VSDLPVGPRGSVVTVGTFDGVHRGHQAIVDEVVRRARRSSRKAVLVTFEPHPAVVLRPDRAPARLTLPAERAAVLAESELDAAVVLRFDKALAALSPEAFVAEVLRRRCGMRELVMGHDHGFGRGRSGDLETMSALGAAHGFEVDVVAPVHDAAGETISSSRIREAIAAGRLAEAAGWLGRPYHVSGEVVVGAGRGRGIGVPTLNLAPPAGKLLPPDGVYAVRVEWGGGVAGGMMNQGARPTVGDGRRWIEAHLFDFEGDLYGREVRIEWVARLRDIQRFASLAELRVQLDTDREQARTALRSDPNP